MHTSLASHAMFINAPSTQRRIQQRTRAMFAARAAAVAFALLLPQQGHPGGPHDVS
jgi:hypothetical protein